MPMPVPIELYVAIVCLSGVVRVISRQTFHIGTASLDGDSRKLRMAAALVQFSNPEVSEEFSTLRTLSTNPPVPQTVYKMIVVMFDDSFPDLDKNCYLYHMCYDFTQTLDRVRSMSTALCMSHIRRNWRDYVEVGCQDKCLQGVGRF